jgi:predicted O-linked N-acetylglucosamine transferase (SPINDLY family)
MKQPDLTEYFLSQRQRRESDDERALRSTAEQYRNRLAVNRLDCDAYEGLARCYRSSGDWQLAVETLRDGVKHSSDSFALRYQLIKMLESCGLNNEALAALSDARQALPQDFRLQLADHLFLPRFYETQDELTFFRQRFEAGLLDLVRHTRLNSQEEVQAACDAIGLHTNFLLAYHGYNDLDWQRIYGAFVHNIMSRAFPDWAARPDMPPVEPALRPRVGYLSARFWNHTVAHLFLGWLKHRTTGRYECYCYHTGTAVDFMTHEFRRRSDHFHHLPGEIEAACRQIRTDNLHVLIFTDIGMDPSTTQIAALRLAPVQCAAWGHPVTTGLPTVDYFLSSDAMEPADAQNQYSERLVRLPGLGICFPKPVIPRALLAKTREDFGLKKQSTIYLSCQSIFKYLPKHDHVFARIASQVSDAHLVFVGSDGARAEKFLKRLGRAFSQIGLSAEDRCTVLPELSGLDFWNLHLLADVCLDTLGWSGGKTTLEAVACGLPVVTCPGEFMRSRHSAAILRLLRATETIARDEGDYVRIAVKLGLDGQWRNSVRIRMAAGHPYLYSDETCVSALESFLEGAIDSASKSPRIVEQSSGKRDGSQ